VDFVYRSSQLNVAPVVFEIPLIIELIYQFGHRPKSAVLVSK